MFRALQGDDRPVLRRLLDATGLFTKREKDVCLEMADEVVDGGNPDEYRVVCAVDGENVCEGFVMYGEASLADRVWEVYWVVVDPARQGRGLGRRLMDQAEEAMMRARARMVMVETSGRPEYGGTLRFYDRCGYREVARVADFYRDGDDLVMLRKDITGMSTGR